MRNATIVGAAVLIVFTATFALMFSHTSMGLASVAASIFGSPKFTRDCVAAIDERTHTARTVGDFTTQTVSFDPGAREALALRSNTDAECGSAGCVIRLCERIDGAIKLLPFAYAGESLTVLPDTTNDKHDLRLTGTTNTIFTWDGIHYTPQGH